MKKITTASSVLSIMALFAAAVATSCSNDNDIDGGNGNGGDTKTVTLTAAVSEDDATTRVGMTKEEDDEYDDERGEVSFYWHSGDAIFVQTEKGGTYGGAKFTTGAETGSTSADFTGEVASDYSVGSFAVYPYNENHKFTYDNNKTTLTYNLPASYDYTNVGSNIFSKTTDGNTTYPANSTNMPLYGMIDNNNNITFYHIGSLAVIRFNDMPVTEGTLTVTADQQLCGDFTVDFSSSIEIATTTASNDNGKVTFNFKDAKVGDVGVFYLPLATGEYTNVKITVANTDNNNTQTISCGNVDMYCGYVTAIPITKNKYDIAAKNGDATIYYKFNNDEKTNLSVTYLYHDVENYSGSVTIPESVTDGDKTYSVTAIEDEAFSSCINLTSVTIPSSVTSIGNGAFCGCSSLTNVTMGSGVKTIGVYAFESCSKLTSITIPDGVTSIGEGAFYGCSVLDNVTIPNGVTSIETGVFYNCTGLKSVKIGSGVKTIGYCAFLGCGLTSVTIPNSVTSIGDGAFSECISLKSVTIGSGVTTIGQDAFYFCFNLTSVTIPDGVTSIGDGAFYNCTGLKSVTIGNGVTTIGTRAFSECESLTSVTIGSGVTTIEEESFSGCSALDNVTIPDKVTSIGDKAFLRCSGLTSVTIGSGVTTIGIKAFQSCSALDNVTIPDGVTSIGDAAFYKCTGLNSVKIGSGVTTIGSQAFANDTKIETLSVSAVTPPTIESNTLPYTGSGTEKKCSIGTLYVPTNSVDTYQKTQYWNDISSIVALQ